MQGVGGMQVADREDRRKRRCPSGIPVAIGLYRTTMFAQPCPDVRHGKAVPLTGSGAR